MRSLYIFKKESILCHFTQFVPQWNTEITFQTMSVYCQSRHIFNSLESRRVPSLRARPKSMSFILLPVLLTHMMFSGLRSRCTMPCLWINWTPSIICSIYLMTSRSDSSKSSSTIRSNSSPPEILQPTRTREPAPIREHKYHWRDSTGRNQHNAFYQHVPLNKQDLFLLMVQ